jgi:hemin uptake protein HemP
MLTLRHGVRETAAGAADSKRTARGNAVPDHGTAMPVRRRSTELFGGRDRVVIEHQGQEYQLRITRFGKLILTK